MALELIAALAAAFALAGIAMLARRLSGGRMPRWIVPAAAGIGLIGFTIWSEYDWYHRATADLPEGVTVVWQDRGAMPLRPWTYLFPLTTHFVALDRREMAAHPVRPELRMAQVYDFGRWRPVQAALMVFDCAGGRHALLTAGAEVTAEGTLSGADWTVPAADDPVLKAACGAAPSGG
ncbi:hypothetical protein [Frigidibacter sp. SD6-1]|uniref:hypothetical protein n=1 Tax=Frigidibacter sp. SD6-1 TaxID=3032581 RepID=UPI0024DF3F68|nr:hypothetical protein [Frigidibacter sp. SD6-1]